MRWIHGLAFAAASAVAAQPCLAAGADGRLLATGHVGAFAGASFTLPLGSGHARPVARLELSPAFAVADPISGETFQRRGAGLALGLTRAGKPDLRFAGRSEAEVGARSASRDRPAISSSAASCSSSCCSPRSPTPSPSPAPAPAISKSDFKASVGF